MLTRLLLVNCLWVKVSLALARADLVVKKGIHYDNKLSCGSGWQEHYRRLHSPVASLLASTPPGEWGDVLKKKNLRVAIDLVREGKYHGGKSGGVGDRFAGMVTLFALALLNDVPFFMDFPRLSDAFESGEGHLNWALSIDEYINVTGFRNVNVNFPYWTQARFISSFKKSNHKVYAKLAEDLTRKFEYGEFREKFTKANVYRAEYLMNTQPITVVRSAAGYITTLFKQGKYADRLHQWGLKPENTFGCLFDFLLRPNDALRREFKSDLAALSNPETLKILVQIRSGDAQIGSVMNVTEFSSQPSTLRDLCDRFFACSMQFQEVHAAAYNNVTWYLMTDSYVIKQYAKQKFGDKILTHDSKIINMLSGRYDLRTFLEVIGEQWCASKCDYFVTSSARSGLGTQAAFRSRHVANRVHSISYSFVSKKSGDGKVTPTLTLPHWSSSQRCYSNPISVLELGSSYSGI